MPYASYKQVAAVILKLKILLHKLCKGGGGGGGYVKHCSSSKVSILRLRKDTCRQLHNNNYNT